MKPEPKPLRREDLIKVLVPVAVSADKIRCTSSLVVLIKQGENKNSSSLMSISQTSSYK